MAELRHPDLVDPASLRSYLAAIVESSDDAIIGKDLDGIITSWNRGAERIYGYTATEMIGRSITLLTVPGQGEEIEVILTRINNGERIEHYETKRRRRDGSIIDISLAVSPIKGDNDRIVGASAIGRDITEAKRAAAGLQRALDDLRRLTDELARSNSELQRFAHVASHDLQEPARTVATYCELLEHRCKGQLDEKAREWIGYAVAGARRMRTMVADTLEYSRLETRTRPLAPTDCAGPVAEALANLHLSVEESLAEVRVDPLPVVMANAPRLVQLFQNLIGNAIKYAGDTPPRVHISAERRDDEWVFSVRDNGIGIELGHREQIFDVFQRLHPQDRYPGTGIGLAICKRVVEQHRGRIWVESEPGNGSVFYFSLPIDAGG